MQTALPRYRFQMNEWIVDLYNETNSVVNDGADVYYQDTAIGPVGDVNYHLVIGGTATDRDAYAGKLTSRDGSAVSISANTVAKNQILLLLPGPAAAAFA